MSRYIDMLGMIPKKKETVKGEIIEAYFKMPRCLHDCCIKTMKPLRWFKHIIRQLKATTLNA
jgi:hypothetical protein